MQDLEIRKFRLIKQIADAQNEYLIKYLEVLLQDWNHTKIDFDLLAQLSQPVQKDISIENLIQKQNYSGIDRQYFDSLVEEIHIEETLEELIIID